jgi:hypothetical protein
VPERAHTPPPQPNPAAGLREGPPDTFADRVFDNAIAVATHATRGAYERMLFREGLKAAGYDLGNARDVYRQACGEAGMNCALVHKFIEVRPEGHLLAGRGVGGGGVAAGTAGELLAGSPPPPTLPHLKRAPAPAMWGGRRGGLPGGRWRLPALSATPCAGRRCRRCCWRPSRRT